MEFFIIQKPQCLREIGKDIFQNTLLYLLEKHNIPIELTNAYLGVLPKDIIENHYANKKTESYFGEICDFMTSGPCVLLKFKTTCDVVNDELFKTIKNLVIGPTDPRKADPFTMRYMFGTDIMMNGLHFPTSLKDATDEYENLRLAIPYLKEIPVLKTA